MKNMLALVAAIVLIILVVNFGLLKGLLIMGACLILLTVVIGLVGVVAPGRRERMEFVRTFDDVFGAASWGPGGSRRLNDAANHLYHEWRSSGSQGSAQDFIIERMRAGWRP